MESFTPWLERLRRLTPEHEEEDLKWIQARSPESKLAKLRDDSDWERTLLLASVFKLNGEGTLIPGPRHGRLEEYRANRTDILAKKLRIRQSTGQVVPVEDGQAGEPPVQPMTRREIEERKSWCFNLSIMGQRARVEAIKRLRDNGFALSEAQQIDYDYLREILRM